jgi:hypothetical protein
MLSTVPAANNVPLDDNFIQIKSACLVLRNSSKSNVPLVTEAGESHIISFSADMETTLHDLEFGTKATLNE